MNTQTVAKKATLHAVEICETDPKSNRAGLWFWNYNYGIGEGYLRTVSKSYFASRADAEKDLGDSRHAEVSLTALDLGFNPRLHQMTVKLPACVTITAHTDEGTVTGALPDVIDTLRNRGWKVYRDVLTAGAIA